MPRAAQLFSNPSVASSHKDNISCVIQNKEHGTQQGNTQGLSLGILHFLKLVFHDVSFFYLI